MIDSASSRHSREEEAAVADNVVVDDDGDGDHDS